MCARNGRHSAASTGRLVGGVPRLHMSGGPAFGCQVAADPFLPPPAEMQLHNDEVEALPLLYLLVPLSYFFLV